MTLVCSLIFVRFIAILVQLVGEEKIFKIVKKCDSIKNEIYEYSSFFSAEIGEVYNFGEVH